MSTVTLIALVIRFFPDPLAPVGHVVILGGQRYRVVALIPGSDGRVKHQLQPLPDQP